MRVYFFDGSREGFFTAVFYGYTDKSAVLSSDRNYQLGIGDEERVVVTEEDKAERVVKKLREYDMRSLRAVDYMLRSAAADREQTAFLYVRATCKNRASVAGRYGDETVMRASEIMGMVSKEIDKLYGLLRFMECKNGLFYAPYQPDGDITALIAGHFMRRFRGKQFIIHDVGRGIALMYNGKDCMITELESASVYLSEDEENFKELWRCYYDSVNIAERKNDKLMRGYMPVRYWKYLPEKNRKVSFGN